MIAVDSSGETLQVNAFTTFGYFLNIHIAHREWRKLSIPLAEPATQQVIIDMFSFSTPMPLLSTCDAVDTMYEHMGEVIF